MMKKGKSRSKQGWTMLEMLMVSSIFLVVSAGAAKFLDQQTDFWEYSTTQTDMRADIERGLQNAAKELQSARRVTPGTPPSISIPAYPNNTSITFYVPTDMDGLTGVLNSTGDVEWDVTNPIQFTYDSGSKQLLRIEGGATRVLATDISAAAFNDATTDNTLLPNELRISLTMLRTTLHRRTLTATGATIVKLRN